MKQTQAVELFCDADELRALLSEMHALLDELPMWMRWLSFHAFEHIDQRVSFIAADRQDSPTVTARRCIGRLEPSKELILFVTALRARKGDGPSQVVFESNFCA